MASSPSTTAATANPARPLGIPVPWWAWLAVGLLAMLVFAIAFAQAELLQPVLGKAATGGNYLHEFFHDARHLLGFPCH